MVGVSILRRHFAKLSHWNQFHHAYLGEAIQSHVPYRRDPFRYMQPMILPLMQPAHIIRSMQIRNLQNPDSLGTRRQQRNTMHSQAQPIWFDKSHFGVDCGSDCSQSAHHPSASPPSGLSRLRLIHFNFVFHCLVSIVKTTHG